MTRVQHQTIRRDHFLAKSITLETNINFQHRVINYAPIQRELYSLPLVCTIVEMGQLPPHKNQILMQTVISNLRNEIFENPTDNLISFWDTITGRQSRSYYDLIVNFPVRDFGCNREILKIVFEELKGGSFFRHCIPALQHNTINVIWQVVTRGLCHAVAAFDLFNHFASMHPGVWNLAVRKEFHEEDAIGPYIRFYTKSPVHDCFRCSPFHRESRT